MKAVEPIQRRGTSLDEDQVVLLAPPNVNNNPRVDSANMASSRSVVLPSTLGSLEAEFGRDLSYACLGSNKQGRPENVKAPTSIAPVNEDKITVETITVRHNGVDEEISFVGIYDGHGGSSHASAFVSEQLKKYFKAELETIDDTDTELADRIAEALRRSFKATDLAFYHKVMEEAARANLTPKIKDPSKSKCCKFFNEDPCACMRPPIAANEGTTATIVVLTSSNIICANVGDSDAYLAVTPCPPEEEHSDIDGSSPISNSSVTTSLGSSAELDNDQLVRTKRIRYNDVPAVHVDLVQVNVTDTPIPSEDNEDYRRIRSIAGRRAGLQTSLPPGSMKLPSDGIIKSIRGDRFNYVAVPGARSLNMVRAFGNLGNKTFKDKVLVEEESPIISRPHVQIFARDKTMCAVVLGSDGLWDNIEQTTVSDMVKKYFCSASSKSQDAAKSCAKDLFFRALHSRRKPDDISVAVVSLGGIDNAK